MEVKTMKTIFKVVAIAGVPVTGFLAARGGKTKAEKILNGEPYETGKDKFVLNAKSYGPAVAAGAVTITSIVLSDYFGAKELAAATALAAGVAARKDQIKQQFDKYRDVVKEEEGEKRDIEIMQAASQATYDGNGEQIHKYRLDWTDKPIYFESTHARVLEALNRINQELVDYSHCWGLVTVSKFLEYIDKKDLITTETDKAGWSYDLLNVECDCYWLDFYVFKAGESEWYRAKGEDPNTYVINVGWGPWDDLMDELEEQRRIGTI